MPDEVKQKQKWFDKETCEVVTREEVEVALDDGKVDKYFKRIGPTGAVRNVDHWPEGQYEEIVEKEEAVPAPSPESGGTQSESAPSGEQEPQAPAV